MNKKGFAISSIIYSILILFLLLIFSVLSLLGSRKIVLDKIKNDIMDTLNDDKIEDVNVVGNIGPSIASKPELTDKLLPVIYDGSNWKVADVNQWYDYDNKKWANAVIVDKEKHLFDLSGNGYDAIIRGGNIIDVNGEKAIELDGIDDYIEVPVLPETINWTDGYTVEVTINIKSFSNYARIMDFGNATTNNLIIAGWGTNNFPYLAYYNNATRTNYPYSSTNYNLGQKQTYRYELINTGGSYYTIKSFIDNNLSFDNSNTISSNAFINTTRYNNYIGKSNWNDPYLSAYLYEFKIVDNKGNEILHYNVNDTKDLSLNNYQVGQIIPIQDMAQMYVWIPRYEYKLPSESIGTTETPQPIDIQFIDKNKTTADTGYSIHPGFTFDGQNKNGIWIGKFETSTTDELCLKSVDVYSCDKVQSITILPNKNHLGDIKISNMFGSSKKVQTDYNLTGVDVHMSKYTEWTAVSYLTNSKYGRCEGDLCEEVTINNVEKDTANYTTQTGCAGNSTSEPFSLTCQNEYNTVAGQKASTTGNITGVYDMSGGAWEYVMGAVIDASGSSSDVSGFSNSLNNSLYENLPNKKYYDEFTLNGLVNGYYSDIKDYNGQTNFAGILLELQNSKIENYTWFEDTSRTFLGQYVWEILGGASSSGSGAGVFSSASHNGSMSKYYGFRVSIVSDK